MVGIMPYILEHLHLPWEAGGCARIHTCYSVGGTLPYTMDGLLHA